MRARSLAVVVAASLLAAVLHVGIAAAAPKDFSAVSKLVSQSTKGGDTVFRSKILTRIGGRVIGSSVNRGAGKGRFVEEFEFDDGSVITKGKVQPAISDPGFSRISGGTGAYEGASGRMYYRDLKPGFSKLFFDFTPLEPTA